RLGRDLSELRRSEARRTREADGIADGGGAPRVACRRGGIWPRSPRRNRIPDRHSRTRRQLGRRPVHGNRFSQGLLPQVSHVPAVFPAHGTRTVRVHPGPTANPAAKRRQELTMRFPLTLTSSVAGYMARKKMSGEKRFPLVLMLEPLHACNL